MLFFGPGRFSSSWFWQNDAEVAHVAALVGEARDATAVEDRKADDLERFSVDRPRVSVSGPAESFDEGRLSRSIDREGRKLSFGLSHSADICGGSAAGLMM